MHIYVLYIITHTYINDKRGRELESSKEECMGGKRREKWSNYDIISKNKRILKGCSERK